ncbi:TBC1 domain family member 9, partial [Geodia barretti]
SFIPFSLPLSLSPSLPPSLPVVVFEQLTEKHLPELYQLLKHRLNILSMISLSWFLTLFFSVMDSSTAVNILDCFFVDGAKVLFQVALMILKFIESPLLSSSDEAEAIGKLNEFLAELGKKASQENKVELEEEIKKQAPVSIHELIKQSYECFGFISNSTIERMRMGARLEVCHHLQDSSRRSILRTTMEGSKFTRPELEQLYFWFEEGHQQALFWGGGRQFMMVSSSHVKQEPTIDVERFSMLFRYLSPWGFGEHAEVISHRAFRERLKLLYCLHIISLTTPTNPTPPPTRKKAVGEYTTP